MCNYLSWLRIERIRKLSPVAIRTDRIVVLHQLDKLECLSYRWRLILQAASAAFPEGLLDRLFTAGLVIQMILRALLASFSNRLSRVDG